MAGTGSSFTPPPPPPGPRVERTSAVTDSSGNAVLTWPAGAFTVPPVVTLSVEGAGFLAPRVTASTPASCTVQVLNSAGVTLLGIGVLAAAAGVSGVTVHGIAVAA